MNLDATPESETSQFQQLLTRWRNGELSREETSQLARLLKDAEMRAELVSEWLLDEAIYHTLRARLEPLSAPATARTRSAPTGSTARPQSLEPRHHPWLVWHKVRVSIGWSFGLAATACFILAGVYFYFQTAAAGSLTEVRGQVVIERGEATLPGQTGALLYPGDRVRVPVGGAAVLGWNEEPSRIELREDAALQLGGRMRGKRLWLRTGTLEAEVAPQPRWRPMIIGTPQAEVRVVGTHFSLSATPILTRLDVFEGAVRLLKTHLNPAENEREVMVRGGQTVSAAPGLKLDIQYLTGLLSSDLWAVPPGTALVEAPARGTLLTQNTAADPARSVERLRGYLIAPQTGDFTFWVGSFAGDQPVEFWMSPDEDPTHKRRLAYYTPQPSPAGRPGTTGPLSGGRLASTMMADWSRAPSQKSPSQPLVQGQRYYLEVWHQGSGISSLGLGWQTPGELGDAPPQPVDIRALCPFVESAGAENRTLKK